MTYFFTFYFYRIQSFYTYFCSNSSLRCALRPSGCGSYFSFAEYRSRIAARSQIKRIHHRENPIEVGDLQDDREIYRGNLFTALHT